MKTDRGGGAACDSRGPASNEASPSKATVITNPRSLFRGRPGAACSAVNDSAGIQWRPNAAMAASAAARCIGLIVKNPLVLARHPCSSVRSIRNGAAPEHERALGAHVLRVLEPQPAVCRYLEQNDTRRHDLDVVASAPLDGAVGFVARGDERAAIGMQREHPHVETPRVGRLDEPRLATVGGHAAAAQWIL